VKVAMTRWALISDESTRSRTACLLDVVRRLRDRGVSVGGFFQRRTDDDKGFEVIRLSDERDRVTLAQKPVKNGIVVDDAACDYVFEETAFTTARGWVEEDAKRCDLLVLDVISKMETYGHGHAESLKTALATAGDRVVLIGVRASQLNAIINAFDLDVDSVVTYLELPVPAADHERFVEELACAASRSPSL